VITRNNRGLRRALLLTGVAAIALSAGTASRAQPATAQSSIGSATAIKNDVQGVHGSVTRVLAAGGDVFSDDRVKTGDDSLARLVFLDRTTLTVAADSQAVLKEVYRPKQGFTRLVVKTVTGSFRFVSGVQSPHHYEVQFPQGYLTVRGTIVDLVVSPTRTLIVLESGSITVVPYATRIPHDLSGPDTSLVVYNDGRVDGPMTREAAIIKLHPDIPIQFGSTISSTWEADSGVVPFGATPYVALGGGFNFEGDPAVTGVADLNTFDGPLPNGSYPIGVTKSNGLGTGALGLVAAGLQFQSGWRTEIEGSYRHNATTRFNVQAEGSTTIGVDRKTYAQMFDVWRDFALVDRVGFHVGGGLGVAELDMNVTNSFSASTAFNKTEGAYQAGAGLDFAVIPGLKVTLDYRALGFFNKDAGNITVPTSCSVSPSGFPCFGNANERVVLGVSSAAIDQSVILGLRWSGGP